MMVCGVPASSRVIGGTMHHAKDGAAEDGGPPKTILEGPHPTGRESL